MYTNTKDKGKTLGWDHPEFFGPVPKNKKQEGNKVCKSGGASKAIGFHPQAKGTDGAPFKSGGYYCQK